jgi:L-asparaginase/Glu-tRNA(Gln) amidotransferase subunit D
MLICGTDAMPHFGRIIDSLVSNKSIAITGALIPIANGNSDAGKNIGDALEHLMNARRTRKNEVSIVFDSKIYRPMYVEKNIKENKFEIVGGIEPVSISAFSRGPANL